VNALSSNAGTCKICGNEHPTLRCRSLTEENIPSALIHRPQQLKLVSEEQQKQKAQNREFVDENVTAITTAGENSDRTNKGEGEGAPDSKFTVPELPRWRFLSKAKKTEGYSSTAAGTIVKGEYFWSYITPLYYFYETFTLTNIFLYSTY